MQLAPGTAIADGIRLERKLGEGGHGDVWAATHDRLGREVAVKVLRPGGDGTVQHVTRFIQEAKLIAELPSQHIVQILEFGQSPRGIPFWVMELLEGEDLQARLTRPPLLSIGQTVAAIVQIGRALAAAHEIGIIHRDVKPANVFLVSDPTGKVHVKLLDFGVAKRIRGPDSGLTQAGMVIGTPLYMSPEQLFDPASVDHRADLWGTAVVAYFCLTGALPFEEPSLIALSLAIHKGVFAEPTRLRPELPPAIDVWMKRALAQDPGARFGSAQELAATLQRAAFDNEISSPSISGSRTPRAAGASELRMRASLILPGLPGGPARDRALLVVRVFQGDLVTSAPGMSVVRFAPFASADESAARAVRCALSLRRALGMGSCAVVVDRATPDPEENPGAERGAALLAGSPHGIRLDDTTAALLRERFAIEQDEGGWVVRDARPTFEPEPGLLGGPTPFVGREREYRLLAAELQDCIERSSPKVVLVTGEAGIGKSRLRQAFTRMAGARTAWFGRALPGEADAAYGLLRTVLAGFLGVTDVHSADQIRERVAIWAGDAPDEAALVTIAALASSADSVAAEGRHASPAREQVAHAWSWVVGRQCERGPLVLVLEDIHWADRVSLELIDQAIQRYGQSPLFLFASARPSVHDRIPDLWRRRARLELALERIADESAARLVRAVLGEETGDLAVAKLVEQAEGNPFMLEELIRASMKRGTGAPPEPVLAMVEARIAQREPDERRLLRAASVLGPAFDLEALMALLRTDRAEVLGQLDALERAELLAPEASASARSRHRFRHAIIRDAAYAMLPPEERESHHQRAAEWLMRRGADPSEIASHLQHAGRTGAAAEQHARASEFLARAGDLENAERHVDQALALGAFGADGADALSSAERSLRAVVLADARRLDPFDQKALRLIVPEAAAMMQALGGHLVILDDGSLAVAFSDATALVDLVERAARAGLALARLLSTRCARATEASSLPVMALAIGASESVVEGGFVEVIESARRLTEILGSTEARRGLAVDDIAAPILDSGFVVEQGDVATVSAERDAAPAARTLLGRATPCLGRDREIELLVSSFDACVANRRAAAWLVTASSGVGKSRLRFEALRELWRRGRSAHVLFARGDAIRASAPFSLLLPALRRAFGVREDEPAIVQRQRISERVRRRLDPAEAERLCPWLTELCGVAPDPEHELATGEARRDPAVWSGQLAHAFEELLAVESNARPVVLVLEDLHWGDGASVQVVLHCLRALSDRPLFVLAVARPEVTDKHPGLSQSGAFVHLALPDLGDAAARALAREVLGAYAGADVIDAIVAQAGGNAFLLEELLRATAEGHVHSPRTAIAVSQMRIEALPPARRKVLRAASIFGERAWASGLIALLGETEAVVEHLDALVEAEFFTRASAGRFAGQGAEVVFRHALLREAAYGLLTEADRRAGHRRAAEWLKVVAPDDFLAVAEHLEQANEPTAAVGSYRRAAEKALEGNDLDATLAHSARAIAIGATGEELADLHHLRMSAHTWRGARDDVLASSREVLALAAFASVPWCDAAVARAGVECVHGDRTWAHELAGTMEGLLGTRARTPALSLAAARLVEILFNIGDNTRAVSLRRVVLPAIDELAQKEPRLYAYGQIIEGWYSYLYGAIDDSAHVHQRAAIAALLDLGNVRRASLECANQATGFKELGELEAAEAAARQGLALSVRHGIQRSQAAALLYLGIVRARRGGVREGLDLLTEASELARSIGDAHCLGPTFAYRAEAHGLSGDWMAAATDARTALSIARGGESTLRITSNATLSQALLRMGQTAEALDAARAAVALVDATDQVEEGATLAYVSLVEALDASGDGSTARGVLSRAMSAIEQRASRIRRDAVREQFRKAGPYVAETRSLAVSLLG